MADEDYLLATNRSDRNEPESRRPSRQDGRTGMNETELEKTLTELKESDKLKSLVSQLTRENQVYRRSQLAMGLGGVLLALVAFLLGKLSSAF